MTHSTSSDPSSSSCVFCEIVAGTLPCAKVAEDDVTFAFMDIDPGSDGHLLVIPKRHSIDLLDVPTDDLSATMRTAQRIAKVIPAQLGADGVNLLNCSGAAAWQTVFHFHVHVIPRYSDRTRDRMELPFEPGSAVDPGMLARQAALISGALQRE